MSWALPVAIMVLIVWSMRHPLRSFVSALAIFLAGVVLIPVGALGALSIWHSQGRGDVESLVISCGLLVLGFWGVRRWIKSPPRSARRQVVTPVEASPVVPAIADPQATLQAEVNLLRVEVAALRAERYTTPADASNTPVVPRETPSISGC